LLSSIDIGPLRRPQSTLYYSHTSDDESGATVTKS
jgi:hypothetical protein